MEDLNLTVEFNEGIVKKACQYHWLRSVGWHTLIISVLLIVICILLYITGNRSWTLGFISGLAGIGLFALLFSYIYKVRSGIKKLLSMDNQIVSYRINKNGLSVASSLGNSNMDWKLIKQLHKKSDIWLFYFDECNFITLPVHNLLNEEKHQIAEYANSAGTKIT